MSHQFDIRMALIAIVILSFLCWVYANIPTLVAGLLIGLAVYCFIRLFPLKRGRNK